jgi:hypothetical protein
MTNICAAISLAQIERCDQILQCKRRLAQLYAKKLEGVPLEIHRESPNVVHGYWMISIFVPSLQDRDPLREALGEEAGNPNELAQVMRDLLQGEPLRTLTPRSRLFFAAPPAPRQAGRPGPGKANRRRKRGRPARKSQSRPDRPRVRRRFRA